MPYPNPPSTEKTNRIGSRPPSQTTYLEAVSVNVTVAISAQRNQVFVYIIAAQPASRANVVDLGTTRFRMLCVGRETYQFFCAKLEARALPSIRAVITMDYLTALQWVLERLPIRGRGRIADALLSNVIGEFECHPLPRIKVSVRASQRIERWMWAGAYEPELVSLLKKTLKSGMSVLDLGANIGYFSVIAAALVGENGQVHAFEPMPQNLDRLRKNLLPFHWAMAHPYAVGNRTGEAPIHYSDKEAGWASIDDQHPIETLPCNSTVSVIRLDDWLQTNSVDRIDFIKLDIEGSELDALLGARQALSHFHPTIVAETKGGWHHDEIRQLLGATGYKCRSFCGDSILGIPSA